MVAVRVDVTPRVPLPIGGRGGLGLLGKGLGDEDALLWSWGALLVLVGSSLVLTFIVPVELGSLFRMGAPIRQLPKLAGGLDLMVTKFLVHPNSMDIGVK